MRRPHCSWRRMTPCMHKGHYSNTSSDLQAHEHQSINTMNPITTLCVVSKDPPVESKKKAINNNANQGQYQKCKDHLCQFDFDEVHWRDDHM